MAQYYNPVKYALLYLKVHISFQAFPLTSKRKFTAYHQLKMRISDFKWRVMLFSNIFTLVLRVHPFFFVFT